MNAYEIETRVQMAEAAIDNGMIREIAGEFILVLEDEVFPERTDAIWLLLQSIDSTVHAVRAMTRPGHRTYCLDGYLAMTERERSYRRKCRNQMGTLAG